MQTDLPANGGYMLAAYLIVGALVLGYAWSLARRAKKALTIDD